MRHPTYKHLEAKLRLGAFSLGQWAQITIAGASAAVFGGYLSPFPLQVTIFVSILGAGLPVALSYGAMGIEFSVAQLARAGWRHRREPRRFMPGAGQPTPGYVIHAEPARIDPAQPNTPAGRELLWDV